MTDIDHGPYHGVVDIARNGIDEVIRLRALNAELAEALRRVKGTGVFLGVIAQEMVDAALEKAEASNGS